jgi:hypothetical protein
MPNSISKGQIVKAFIDLPEDATIDDVIERLLLSKIEHIQSKMMVLIK